MFQRSSRGRQALRRNGLRPLAVAIATVAISLFAPSNAAHAYTISNELAFGCHEEITAQALRNVRTEFATAAPLPATENETALIDDLQFTPDPDMLDLGGATLLAGVRDNDLKGLSSDDLTALAEVHGDPAHQEEHCLRGLTQTEPGGSAAAMSVCRAFIRERAMEAIAGLDAKGMPDLTKRTVLTIYLSIRGQVDAPLPTYYVRMGQAIHAVEDAFTHTYRTADELKVTVVLNWIDQVNGTLVESRDGPGHATELDRCDDPDALRKTRHVLATEAATAMLRATLDPKMTPAEKMATVDTVLDTYLSYSPGCTFDNHWCNAPEAAYANAKSCGCSAGSTRGGLGAMLSGIGLALLAMARRTRRRRPGTVVVGILTVAGAILLHPSHALAQDDRTKTPATDPVAPTTTTTTQVTKPTVGDKHEQIGRASCRERA